MAPSRNLTLGPDPGEIIWAVPSAGQLVWAGRDGFYMVFNPASGEMHLLDGLGREIVDVIAEKPRSTGDLLAEMTKIFDQPPSPGLNEKIMGSLRELDKIGLVEPVDSAAASL